MPWEGVNYLNEFDKDIFINIIKNAANDQNCIISIGSFLLFSGNIEIEMRIFC